MTFEQMHYCALWRWDDLAVGVVVYWSSVSATIDQPVPGSNLGPGGGPLHRVI